MSAGNVVDSKVVELQFNNQNFESNAKTSLSTLERLKAALNFSKDTKGFDEISKSAGKVDVGGLTGGINTLKGALSEIGRIAAFSIIADEAIKAKNAVTGFIDEVTVKQVSAGWSKYAEKTSAVQTIMAATAKDFEDTGVQMDYVNSQLDKLNWFTDETSYNFLDMVNNIGKFTSNNIALDKSVTAMEGISNWAAISGANVGEAGRAMYNLSQAIAVGSVKLMDWKSIENANMATAEFKQTVIDTAVELGQLTKVEDGLYKTTKGTEVSVTKFNNTLSEGWFTSEVLMDTLGKYGEFTDKLHNAMEIVDVDTTSQMLEYVEEFKKGTLDIDEAAKECGVSTKELKAILTDLGDPAMEFGMKAFKAAQEAKTFQEAIDATKDAVSTGWMNTFEIIFGDYEQAKKLWTGVANSMWDIFASGGEARNNYLKEVFQTEQTLNEADWQAFEKSGIATDEFRSAIREVAKEHGVYIAGMKTDEEWLNKALELNALTMTDVDKALELLGKKSPSANKELVEQAENLKKNDEVFDSLLSNIEKYSAEDISNIKFGDGKMTEGLEDLEANMDAIIKNMGLTQDAGEDVVKVLQEMGYFGGVTADSYEGLNEKQQECIESIRGQKLTGQELLSGGIINVLDTIANVLETFKEAWDETFDGLDAGGLHDIIQGFYDASERIKTFTEDNEQLKTIFSGVASAANILLKIVSAVIDTISGVGSAILDALGIDFLDLAASIASAVTAFDNWLSESNLIGTVSSTIASGIGFIVGKAKELVEAFLNLPIVSRNISRFSTAFGSVFGNLDGLMSRVTNGFSRFMKAFSDFGGLKELGILGTLKLFKEQFVDYVASFPGFQNIKNAFSGLFGDIGNILSGGLTSIQEWLTKVKADMDGTLAGDIIDGIIKAVEKVKSLVGDLFGGRFSLDRAINTIKTAIGGIISFLGKIPWGKLVGIAAVAAPIIGIIKLIKKALGIFTAVPKLIGSVGDAVDSVSGYFKAGKTEKNANAIKSLAIAIGILAASVFVLSGIEPAKLWMAVGAIAALAAVMVGVMFLLSKMDAIKSVGIRAGIGLVAIAASILILVGALKMMDSLNPDNLVRNLVVLAALLGAMLGVAFVLSKLNGKVSVGVLGILAFVLAIKILVGVLKDIDALDLKSPLKSVGILVAIMLALGLASRIASGSLGSGLGVLAIAAALLILTKALKELATIKPNKLNGALKALGVMALCLAAMSAINGLAKPSLLSGLSNLASAGALWILADALAKLGSIDSGALRGAEEAIAVLTLCLAGLSAVNSLANPSLLSGLSTLVSAGSLWVLADAAAALAVLDGAGLEQAEWAIGVFTTCLGALNAVNGVLDPSLASGLSTLASGGAIWIVTDAAAKLSTLDPVGLAGAEEALMIMSGCLGALSAIAGLLDPGILAGLSNIELAGGIWILADAMAKLASVDQGALKSATDMLTQMIVIFALLEAVSSYLGPVNPTNILLMVGVIAVLAIVLYALSALPVENVTGVANALSEIFLALGAAMVLIAFAGNLAATAAPGLTTLGIVFGILTAVIVALAALNYFIPDLGTFLQGGIDLLVQIGEGLGRFVGAIIGGGLEEGMSHLPIIGQYLTDFMTNLSGLNSVGTVDVAPLLEALLSILGINIVGFADSVLSLVSELTTGKSAAEQLGDDLTAVSTAMVTWQTNMSSLSEIGEIDFTPLVQACAAVLGVSIVGFADSLLSLVSELTTGKSAAQTFADDLTALGDSLAAWQTATEGLDIEVDFGGIAKLAAAVAGISFEGLFLAVGDKITSMISGKTQMETFRDDTQMLADAIVGWKEKLEGVGEIEVPSDALDNIVDAVDSVEAGGLVDAITEKAAKLVSGKSKMELFAENTAGLATALGEWKTKMDEIGTITVPKDAIDKLVDALGEIPKEGGLFSVIGSFLTGAPNFDSFKEQLGKLGEGIKGFTDALGTDLNTETLTTAATAVTLLGQMGTDLKGQDFGGWFHEGDMTRFGNELVTLGQKLQEFASYEIDTEKLSSLADSAQTLGTFGKFVGDISISEDNVTGLETAIKKLQTATQDLNAIDLSSSDIMDTGKVNKFKTNVETMITAIKEAQNVKGGVSGFIDAIDEINGAALKAAQNAQNQVNDVDVDTSDVGNKIATSTASGISDSADAITGAMNDVIAQAAELAGAAADQFNNVGVGFMTSMMLGITMTGSIISTAVEGAVSSAVSSADSYQSEFESAGSNIVQGLANGISNNASAAINAAVKVVRDTINAANAEAGIASPSKVMYKTGDFFVQGFANGIRENARHAVIVSRDMMSEALASFKGASEAIRDILTGDFDGDPVIRPVLDLSNVEAGSHRLSDMFNSRMPIGVSTNVRAINGSMSDRNAVSNMDILDALNRLNSNLSNVKGGDTFQVNGITYDDGSNISTAVRDLIRTVRVGRRM